ncbi:hypothetical protein [Amycolatopsis anabasis]|uniref:hypothetical protein n=1 Tax=Amycolatopsis anabasis TaxID=1840409 RepID=UPI00131B6A8D|nr:hypothetical protein [Amycolatopsis anabasis]
MTTNLDRWRGTCGTCGAPILWATTRAGKPMPVNPEPAPERGNVLLAVQDGQLVAGVLRRNQAAGAHDAGLVLHTSHFTDCPHADQHRRSR